MEFGRRSTKGGNQMKTSLSMITVSSVIFALVSGAAYGQEKWVVAEVASVTGPAATVGTRLSNVAKMWAEEVNARGGIAGKQVDLITCNDEGKPEKTVACVREANRKGAVLFLAHGLTASVRAMQSALAEGPTLIVASPNIVPPADSFAFQVSPSDAHITMAIANYLKVNGLSKIGMIAATDASGEVGVKSAEEIFAPAGIELRVQRIDLKANDASTQLASVASDDIKVVYSSYSGGGAATVVKSFTNLGFPQPLIVSYANLSQAFIDVVKGVMPPRLLGTGIEALAPEKLDDKELADRSRAFMANYEKRYGEKADMINLLGKMDVDVAEAILTNVSNPADPKAVKKFLESTPVESVERIRFSSESHVGLTEKDVAILEYKDGSWVPADPIGQ
jgi:branched-chain amino acid transport system substrate-binding protein